MKWTIGVGSIVGLGLLGTSLWVLRAAHVKELVEEGLSKHLGLTATLGTLNVQLLPRPRVSGEALALRVPNRPDLPPFISIDRFIVDVGLLSIVREHVDTVRADGLHIAVPPKDSRGDLPGGADPGSSIADIVIDRFITHDAELKFVRRKPGDTPLVFAIHDLEVDDVGFSGTMPFKATLTNPIPKGLIHATGTIGPWDQTNATDVPVSGRYAFEHADLSTINGIGGTLESKGSFSGALTSISAKGAATVPDFSLDLGGKPVALTADFETVIDGTDGATQLTRVDAWLRDTPMRVTGAIDNLDGPGRHDVELHVEIEDGRIEDLLTLVLDTPKPVMTGDVQVTATFKLPPGPTRVRDRVELTGQFGLAETRFTDAQVQQKLRDLSRRSQGKDDDDPMGRVMTNLRGKVTLSKGRARLTQVHFQVPGANVALDGTYALASGALDFQGTLRMEATVSKAVGGWKSIFLKPFDPIFRKDGAGAVLPITITGTREAPKFGLQVKKALTGG